MSLFESVSSPLDDRQLIQSRRYGTIEVVSGELHRIRLRPWPRHGYVWEAKWLSGWKARVGDRDTCRLHYKQPIGHQRFLALSYIESTLDTRWKSVRTAMETLDTIAFIKQSNAIVTEVTNARVTDRLMERLGYERHLESSGGRHFIKRFWGQYPDWIVQQFESAGCTRAC